MVSKTTARSEEVGVGDFSRVGQMLECWSRRKCHAVITSTTNDGSTGDVYPLKLMMSLPAPAMMRVLVTPELVRLMVSVTSTTKQGGAVDTTICTDQRISTSSTEKLWMVNCTTGNAESAPAPPINGGVVEGSRQ